MRPYASMIETGAPEACFSPIDATESGTEAAGGGARYDEDMFQTLSRRSEARDRQLESGLPRDATTDPQREGTLRARKIRSSTTHHSDLRGTEPSAGLLRSSPRPSWRCGCRTRPRLNRRKASPLGCILSHLPAESKHQDRMTHLWPPPETAKEMIGIVLPATAFALDGTNFETSSPASPTPSR